MVDEKGCKDKKDKTLERCINQIFPPEINSSLPGQGNCLTCKYDPDNNKKCAGYRPIKIKINYFEVK